jgi:dTDP-4-dehydrorhamnose 3,5-epimerase
MQRIETALPGVCVLEPRVFSDRRGFFFQSYNRRTLEALGITGAFVQDNHSRSVRGTLRGLHFQVRRPQAKLCRVVQGEVLDVAVDVRRGSPTFGRWTSVLLSADNKRQVYLPRGFAHGFVVLSGTAEFLYKCDELYDPDDQGAIAWDDPDIGIDWGIVVPLLSEKDRANPRLRELAPERLPAYVPAG